MQRYLETSIARQCRHHTRYQQIVYRQQYEPEANILNSTMDGARKERKCDCHIQQSEYRQAQLNEEINGGAQSLLCRVDVRRVHSNGDAYI